jgi:hypothetical protein
MLKEEMMVLPFAMKMLFVPISHLTSTNPHLLVIFPKYWNELVAPELKATSQNMSSTNLLKSL